MTSVTIQTRNSKTAVVCFDPSIWCPFLKEDFFRFGVNVGAEVSAIPTRLTVTAGFLFQATRNTGKNIAGKNQANPSAMLLASALMLDHIGLDKHASLIRQAVYKTLSEKMVSYHLLLNIQ